MSDDAQAGYDLPNFSIDLTGQVALVTGTTSGLGRRFARVLAACGAKVALTGRRTERLAELAEEIKAAGGETISVPLDMQQTDSILAMVEQVETALGPISILINNAGIPDAQRAHKMSLELTDAVFDTNLRGPWVLSCEVARRMIAHGNGGRMVNIASIGAFQYSGQGAALYSVTKMGVVRMTEALAVEWARYGINVNCIAPGAFSSEMMDGMVSRMGDISQHFPRKRICDPALMDSTLLYLVSPASEAVTGTCIKIDDGQGPR
ncbi:MAG: SDR family NAD(P)-dependent oxidoreductase [Pseudomonadota bacterium]